MGSFEIFLLAIALSMDAFSVALATSLKGFNSNKIILTMSAYFGFFQFIMPLIGYLLSFKFQAVIIDYANFLAFILLWIIGLKMIYEHFFAKEDETKNQSNMLILAIATSLDALAVGISFASLGQPIIFPSIIIGVICFFITFSAMQCSLFITDKIYLISKNANLIGGIILILIGLKIIMS